MGNTRSSGHSRIDWLAKESFAPHIDAYIQFLANRDYAANTFSNYLGVVTHRYVEADLAMKEKALARLEAPDTRIRRYQAPDSLIRFLKTL